jgi:hypothetical protein
MRHSLRESSPQKKIIFIGQLVARCPDRERLWVSGPHITSLHPFEVELGGLDPRPDWAIQITAAADPLLCWRQPVLP